MRTVTDPAAAEQLLLRLVDVGLEPLDDRLVPVDHGVDDRVQRGRRPVAQLLRRPLQPRTDRAQVARRRPCRTVITYDSPTKTMT